ncbi:hypothetical protein WME76_35360 [Sorangium sp. So ce119]|uniref:hypothetical protein n=1 Tax=Sorangium sp. So ce119 TaxID=3133279 RepID=UPI003F5D9231
MRFPKFPPGTIGFMIPVRHWVVRHEDLKLAEAVWLAAGAAVATYVNVPVALPAVALAAGIWKVIIGAVRRGAYVNPLQFRILALLKKRGAATVDDVAEELSVILEQPITSSDVQQELDALAKVTLGDGTVVALAAANAEGHWSACGM